MFNKDFNELLSSFSAHNVKYLIVGGYAVALHAQPRATKDLDLFIEQDPENGQAVFAALTQFGAPVQGMNPEDLIEPGSFFRMGVAPLMIEIFSKIDGIDFDQAWQNRVEVLIDEKNGLKALFMSAPDLIQSKLAAGRLIDLADAEAVRIAQSDRIQGHKQHHDPSNSDN
ncbi:MAG TPA: DUF6036 family nucleotidyltransferase [Acidobacteriaceae bacterium]|jgi:hypothetical protein|nr:DUF6036 family nucleotidyltransferase [Acidobacteriaceae bacterium]